MTFGKPGKDSQYHGTPKNLLRNATQARMAVQKAAPPDPGPCAERNLLPIPDGHHMSMITPHPCPWRPVLPALLFALCLLFPAPPASSGQAAGDQNKLLEQTRQDIRDSGRAITQSRKDLEAKRQEIGESVAALKRTRDELALWAWMADNPWDLRDVMEGVDDLRGKARALLDIPDASEADIVHQVNYLDKLEARIAQSLREGLGPENDVQLRLILGDLITLRVRLGDLRTDTETVLRPTEEFLESVDAWKTSLTQELNHAWEPYYFTPDPWLSDLTDSDTMSQVLRDWGKSTRLAITVAVQDREAGEWLAKLALVLVIAVLPWLVIRQALRRMKATKAHPEVIRQFSRAAACLSFGLGIAFFATQIGFVLYSELSALAEVFFTAALVLASRGMTLVSAGPLSSPRTFTRWPLWGLFCLGLLLQVPAIPDPLATPLFALALCGAALLVRRHGRTAETRLDAAISACCVFILPALALCALAGYARAAILATSVLFYAVLSLRLSVAIELLRERRMEVLANNSGHTLAKAILSGLGFPLVLLTVFFFCLVFASTQFEARDIFTALLAQEIHLDYVTLSAQNVLAVILAFYLTRMAIAASRSFLLHPSLPTRRKKKRGVAASTLATIVGYLWWAGFVLCALLLVGFSPTGLAVVAGGLSVGIGFGLQNIVSNFISGLILLFGRSVEPGDVLILGSDMVVVRRVNIRNTVVETMDNATVFVPNSELITGRLTNLSHKDPTVRREVTVGVAYGSDRELVRRLLLEAAAHSPRVLAEPAPSVVFTDFGPSALEFRLRVWINEPQDGLTIVSGVREAIDDLFRQNDVEISFPQTDVHLRSAPGLDKALDAARTSWNTGPSCAAPRPAPEPVPGPTPDNRSASPETPKRKSS